MIVNENNYSNLRRFFPHGAVVLDLETTGLSPLTDQIIEIGAVKVLSSGKTEKYEQLINPGIAIPSKTTEIHHITDEMVADAPRIEEVLENFFNFIDDLPVFAHNATFDLGFLLCSAQNKEIPFPKSKVFCSIKLSRKVNKGLQSHKLSSIADHFNLKSGKLHRAYDDALMCLGVIEKTLEKKSFFKEIESSYLYNLSDYKGENSFNLPEKLIDLKEKLIHQEIVEIIYNGGTLKGQWRPVKPIGFLPSPKNSILYAKCLLSGLFKTFILKKIKDFRDISPEKKKEILNELRKFEKAYETD